MSVERDPYFAGRAIEGKPGPVTGRMLPLLGGWVAVFCLNLITPMMLASEVKPKPGKVGMGLAIVILLAAGSFVVSRYRRFGVAMVIGGAVVAASQFVPVIQIGAGLMALMAMSSNGHAPGNNPGPDGSTHELFGFVATFITGIALMSVALAIGRVVQWMFPPRPVEADKGRINP